MKPVVFAVASLVVLGCLCAVVPNAVSAPESASVPGPAPCREPPLPETPSSLKTVTFPAGSFLIPMDSHQADILRAFGLVHALLRNLTTINRIIQPIPNASGGPDVTIKTNINPAGASYSGGPILVTPPYAAVVNTVKSSFPTASMETTTENFTNAFIYSVGTPTNILVIKGMYGHTEAVLADMQIPCDVLLPADVIANPSLVHEYNLVVDDCLGLYLSFPGYILGAQIKENLTQFVNDGNELIFTDIAMKDFQQFPWAGKLGWAQSPDNNVIQSVDFHAIADFPGQYSGKPAVPIFQMWQSQMGAPPIAADVKIIADTHNYQASGQHRVLACYFYWGEKSGVVEFFGYHPGEQTQTNTGDADSYKLSAFLYGNKFLHAPPNDAGITQQNAVAPATVYLNGTAPDPSQEQASVTISIKAVGADITPENSMKLHYQLMPYIDNVTGSFFDQYGAAKNPASITINPNGSKDLKWIVAFVPAETNWNVTFKITSRLEGYVYVNAAGRSNISFIDTEGKNRTNALLPIKIHVNRYVVLEYYPIIGISLASVAALAAWGVRARRKEKSA